MPERLPRGFPLFPLGIVALPSESVPLHIFEDRYRRMIDECLLADPGSAEGEFGIVWLSDEELKGVGCACEIEQVLERTPDGRMNILARGTRPFLLVERRDDLPYPAGVVEFLAEPDDVPMLWRQYAHRGYLLLQRLDRGLLESRLPPAIFYNLLLTARKSSI